MQLTSARLPRRRCCVRRRYLVGSIPFAYIIVKARHRRGHHHARHRQRRLDERAPHDRLVGMVRGRGARRRAQGPDPDAASPSARRTGVPRRTRMAASAVGAELATRQRDWWQQPLLLASRWPRWPAPSSGTTTRSGWRSSSSGFARTGKGLATGAGALLAYDWRYFVAVAGRRPAVIAITRYMMAGQVAAAVTLPVAASSLRLARLAVRAADGAGRLRGAPQAVRGHAAGQGAQALHQRPDGPARLSAEQRRRAGTAARPSRCTARRVAS